MKKLIIFSFFLLIFSLAQAQTYKAIPLIIFNKNQEITSLTEFNNKLYFTVKSENPLIYDSINNTIQFRDSLFFYKSDGTYKGTKCYERIQHYTHRTTYQYFKSDSVLILEIRQQPGHNSYSEFYEISDSKVIPLNSDLRNIQQTIELKDKIFFISKYSKLYSENTISQLDISNKKIRDLFSFNRYDYNPGSIIYVNALAF